MKIKNLKDNKEWRSIRAKPSSVNLSFQSETFAIINQRKKARSEEVVERELEGGGPSSATSPFIFFSFLIFNGEKLFENIILIYPHLHSDGKIKGRIQVANNKKIEDKDSKKRVNL